jgi:hypothetical protein
MGTSVKSQSCEIRSKQDLMLPLGEEDVAPRTQRPQQPNCHHCAGKPGQACRNPNHFMYSYGCGFRPFAAFLYLGLRFWTDLASQDVRRFTRQQVHILLCFHNGAPATLIWAWQCLLAGHSFIRWTYGR